MQRDGTPIVGRGGYIIITECRDFYNICIREPQVSTDHRMILVELSGCGDWRKSKNCRERSSCPIEAVNRGQMGEEDATFDELQKEIKKPMFTAR